ncbi:hypothetical protein JKP88DRAFT_264392 [Tribonema minus]|uniref:Steroid 5-alpha reductase C-terminal domain-containing protein n=1 Tax=Tribonema minus TaxID=303371 RepID=A0A835YPX5_9STRA|nr:hypothetical protein JKP88DRAFT_264392 [Tribonema minus]
MYFSWKYVKGEPSRSSRWLCATCVVTAMKDDAKPSQNHAVVRGTIVQIICMAIFTQALAYPVGLNKPVALGLGIQWLVYLPSLALKTERFYDLTGSSTFILLATTGFARNGAGFDWHSNWRQLLATGMVVAWAARLGTYLFARVCRVGEDSRFNGVRDNAARALLFWTVQGVWTVVTPMAVLMLQAAPPVAERCWWDYAGGAAWLLGMAIEVAADAQKSAWQAVPTNWGKFIDVGMWSWSRHPNYVGEVLLWWGVWGVCYGGLRGQPWGWYTLVAPVFVSLLFVYISVPLIEEHADKKWGGLAEYQAYKRRTRALLY